MNVNQRRCITAAAIIILSRVAVCAQNACPAPGLTATPFLTGWTPPSITLLTPNPKGLWMPLEFSSLPPYAMGTSTLDFQQLVACMPGTPGKKGKADAAYPPAVAAQFIYFGELTWRGGLSAAVAGQTPGNVTVYVGGAGDAVMSSTDYPTGLTPVSVAAADLRGYYRMDLIVADLESSAPGDRGDVAVLLSNGDGTFSKAATYAAGREPISVAVGDVDGDGIPDIVTADSASDTVSVLIGNGDGTFKAPVSYPVDAPPQGVILADFNGDGMLDIAVGTSTGDIVGVLLNAGKGVFQPVEDSPSAARPAYLAAFDFDGDGKLDIAATDTADGAVSILRGNGDGTFTKTALYAASENPQSLVITDVNGDGIPDIAVAWGNASILGPDNGSGNTTILLGNGDGTFRAPTLWPAGGQPTSPVIADFNEDGKPDLLVAHNGGLSLSLVPGNGDGTFAAPSTIALPTGVMTNGLASLATGDFNADGTPDIVVADYAGGVVVGLGKGDGTFDFQPEIPVTGTPSALAVTDLDGDGAPDLVVASSGNAGAITTLLGKFDGTFHQPASWSGYPINAIGLAVADFDRDGKPDVAALVGGNVTPGAGGYVTILLGHGDGSLTQRASYGLLGYPSLMAAADVNGDGCPDLIVLFQKQDMSPAMDVLLGQCDGTFEQLPAVTVNPGAISILVNDFDGDGHPDIVLSHVSGLTFMAGKGDGTFQAEAAFETGQAAQALALGDLNNDGVPDLVVGRGGLLAFVPGLPLQALRNQSAASFALGPLAAGSLVAAFGSHLATGTMQGPANSLLGTTVTVLDSLGETANATLYYVSPGQVNYQMPGMYPGPGTVTIASGDGHSASAPVLISMVSPGVFTLNPAGLVAAEAKRVHADGSSDEENIFALSDGRVVPLPVSLGPAGDQVFLEIYATGIRTAGQKNVQARIGGVNAPVSAVGPGPVAGLDQVEVQVPRSLAGRGKVSVVLTAAGQVANTTSFIVQ
jgi:uncharacterized protein (TIGR03437 family)